MSRLFISHSSRDNAAAVALSNWLIQNGWDDLFLDFDPQRGIAAGERWERALHKAADRCEAVIFLVSGDWLSSSWCGREFDLAARLSKRMFGVLIDEGLEIESIDQRFTSTWQFTDLASGEDHEVFRAVIPPDEQERHVTFSKKGLMRLKAGLTTAGLDARFFQWPPADEPNREPYRGLLPLDAADAGIFFGRDAPTVAAIDKLRDLATRSSPRILAVLGASGAGKSSFLRAGLLPRLARDDRGFRALPVIRPERDAINGRPRGFVDCLQNAFESVGIPLSREEIRELLAAPEALELRLAELAERATAPALPGEAAARAPAVVLAVDQAEELFQAEGREIARRFLRLLKYLALSEAVRIILVFTIRTDRYAELQTAPELVDRPEETSGPVALRQEIFPLPPILSGNYRSIID
ncbi:MAG: toll/interleukin-1 receptor domain-containing protein, partial [Pseudomonadota bacterium]